MTDVPSQQTAPDSTWVRLAPLSGVVYAVLALAGILLIANFDFLPPAEEIKAFYEDNSDRIELGIFLSMPSMFFFFSFVGILRDRLRTAEGWYRTALSDCVRWGHRGRRPYAGFVLGDGGGGSPRRPRRRHRRRCRGRAIRRACLPVWQRLSWVRGLDWSCGNGVLPNTSPPKLARLGECPAGSRPAQPGKLHLQRHRVSVDYCGEHRPVLARAVCRC